MDKVMYEKQLVELAHTFKYEELLVQAKKMTEEFPDWHIAWHYVAVAYGLKGDHESAVANFLNSLKHKPSSTKALYGLSVSFHALKMYDKAIPCLLKYKKMHGADFRVCFCLGVNFAELGRHEDAVKHLPKL